jgi:hypothetical protein
VAVNENKPNLTIAQDSAHAVPAAIGILKSEQGRENLLKLMVLSAAPVAPKFGK